MGKGMLSLDEENKQKLLFYFNLLDPYDAATGKRKLGGSEDFYLKFFTDDHSKIVDGLREINDGSDESKKIMRAICEFSGLDRFEVSDYLKKSDRERNNEDKLSAIENLKIKLSNVEFERRRNLQNDILEEYMNLEESQDRILPKKAEGIQKIDENIIRTKNALDYFKHAGKRFMGMNSTIMQNIIDTAEEYLYIAEECKNDFSSESIYRYNRAWKKVKDACKNYLADRGKNIEERSDLGKKRFQQVENILSIDNEIEYEKYNDVPINEDDRANEKNLNIIRNNVSDDSEKFRECMEVLPTVEKKVKLISDSIVASQLGMNLEPRPESSEAEDELDKLIMTDNHLDTKKIDIISNEIAKQMYEGQVKVGKAIVKKYNELKENKDYQFLSDNLKMNAANRIVRNSPMGLYISFMEKAILTLKNLDLSLKIDKSIGEYSKNHESNFYKIYKMADTVGDDYKFNVFIENEKNWINTDLLAYDGTKQLISQIKNNNKEWMKTEYTLGQKLLLSFAGLESNVKQYISSIDDPDKQQKYADILFYHREVDKNTYDEMNKDIRDYKINMDKLRKDVVNERKKGLLKNSIEKIDNQVFSAFRDIYVDINIRNNVEKFMPEVEENNLEYINMQTSYLSLQADFGDSLRDDLYDLNMKKVNKIIKGFDELAKNAGTYLKSIDQNAQNEYVKFAKEVYKYAVESHRELSEKYKVAMNEYKEKVQETKEELIRKQADQSDGIIAKKGKHKNTELEIKEKAKESPKPISRPRL